MKHFVQVLLDRVIDEPLNRVINEPARPRPSRAPWLEVCGVSPPCLRPWWERPISSLETPGGEHASGFGGSSGSVAVAPVPAGDVAGGLPREGDVHAADAAAAPGQAPGEERDASGEPSEEDEDVDEGEDEGGESYGYGQLSTSTTTSA